MIEQDLTPQVLCGMIASNKRERSPKSAGRYNEAEF